MTGHMFRRVHHMPPLTNMRLWLDASAESTLTFTGSKVVAWADRSPAHNNLTGYTKVGDAPRVVSTQNGLDVIDTYIDGSNYGGYFYGPISGVDSFCTVFAVWKEPSAGSNPQLFDIRSVGDQMPLYDDGATGGRGIRHRRNSGTLVSGSSSAVDRTWHYSTYRFQGDNNLSHWEDGGGLSGYSGSFGYATGLDRIAIATNGFTPTAGDQYMNAQLAEIIVYGEVIPDNKVLAIEAYLANKWGVS